MSSRLNDYNDKFVYTSTNPENIVDGKKNALFFRKDYDFFINHKGIINGYWEKLPYRTVIIPHPPLNKIIKYKKRYEVWLKTTNGYFDQYGNILTKTGWKFLYNYNIFLEKNQRILRWIFPPPASSYDTTGVEYNRSYDENYFYVKIEELWYRTPLTLFSESYDKGAERLELTTNLPFVDTPRYLPVPLNSNSELNTSDVGVQTYDINYFYIRLLTWRRTTLNVYNNTSKMTMF